MARYKSVKVEVPELDSLIPTLGLDPASAAELDLLAYSYRLVQDTPVDFRGLLPPIAAELFDHPVTVKESAEAIKRRLDTVIAGMADRLPERVLGKSWDLRKTIRSQRKVNEDRLKILLLQQNYQVVVPCPQVVPDLSNGMVVSCPVCQGTGRRLLTGLDAVNWLVREVVDESISESWSVYKLAEQKEG